MTEFGEGNSRHLLYTSRAGSSRHGRSTIWITCPVCDTEVEAYLWSLSGSGKKCPGCDAIHTGWGTFVARAEGLLE